MREISAENYAALKAGVIAPRDFIWFEVRRRDNGQTVTDGYWSDDHATTAHVVDPDTGGSVLRPFAAGGGLIEISPITMVSNLQVQTVTVKFSQAAARLNDLVRTYNIKQGRIVVWRGLYSPTTRVLVAPAFLRFVGYIDKAPIRTPRENDTAGGDVTITCVSDSQELLRANPDTASDASQRLREPTDNFLADTVAVKDWQVSWGAERGTVA